MLGDSAAERGRMGMVLKEEGEGLVMVVGMMGWGWGNREGGAVVEWNNMLREWDCDVRIA